MAETVWVGSLKDALAECPICTEYFNDSSRIPRRLSCCAQSICEPCLEIYSRGSNTISCPICRHKHTLTVGVKSLPKEMVILRFLDVLKTQKDASPLCTDCPDNNTAIAKCEQCGIYLCQPCLNAHVRNRSTRNHKTSTFEVIQALRSTRPRSAVQQRREQNSFKLKEKLDSVIQRMGKLSQINANIDTSQKTAITQVNKCFDDLMDELQQRRGILLSQIEFKADKERRSIKRALESHQNLQGKLHKALEEHGLTSSFVDNILKESPEDVEYVRFGVSFTDANVQQLTALTRSVGLIRCVTFTPTSSLSYVPDNALHNAVRIKPDEFPEVPEADMKITKPGQIICPHLDLDMSTASDAVTVSASTVNNSKPNPPPDTGCRFQTDHMVLSYRPLTPRAGCPLMIQTRVTFTVKQVKEEFKLIHETSLSQSPTDAAWSQNTGLGVRVLTCPTHKQQLCLRVRYDNKLLTDVPLTKNQVGVSRDLHLGFLLDRDTSKIHVIDVSDVKVISSVSDVVFDKPFWVKMYLDGPSYSDMRGELISGNKVTVTQEIKQLLSSFL